VLRRQPLAVRAVLSYGDLFGIPNALTLGDPIKYTRFSGCPRRLPWALPPREMQKAYHGQEECPSDSG